MGKTIYGAQWDNYAPSYRAMLERGLRRIAREFGGAMRHSDNAKIAQRDADRSLKSLAV